METMYEDVTGSPQRAIPWSGGSPLWGCRTNFLLILTTGIVEIEFACEIAKLGIPMCTEFARGCDPCCETIKTAQ
jgi:hypothetical protein